MLESGTRTFIRNEAKAWLHRPDGSTEVIRVVSAEAPRGQQRYDLLTAYDQSPDQLGRILFDANGYWIYDGEELSVREQEQLAEFIMNYKERV